MKPPAVSIVIPAYNAAPFIEKTLESVRAQTFSDYEIIVVDDGSKDDTKGVVDAYLARHGLRGQCIKQPNKKIAAARNTGVAEARGPIVAFLDHDDTWAPEKLARIMDEFARHPEAGLVHHRCRIVDPKGRVLGRTHTGPGGDDVYRSLLLMGNAVCPSAVSVRSERLTAVGGFRENAEFDTVEDYDLWLRLSRVCAFRFVGESLGDYLMVPSGASKRVVYHYGNLEQLLLDHFARYDRKDLWTRVLMQRRMSQVYRAAGRALMKSGDYAGARDFVRRSLLAFPLDPKNLTVGMMWVLRIAA